GRRGQNLVVRVEEQVAQPAAELRQHDAFARRGHKYLQHFGADVVVAGERRHLAELINPEWKAEACRVHLPNLRKRNWDAELAPPAVAGRIVTLNRRRNPDSRPSPSSSSAHSTRHRYQSCRRPTARQSRRLSRTNYLMPRSGFITRV